MNEPFDKETDPMTRQYGPKPQNPKDSGGIINQLRARRNRPKPLFRVESFVWETVKGGGLEKRVISGLKYDKVQGTWSYLVKEEPGGKDLGWLREYSLVRLDHQ
ncbi:MAG: hypothetical protein ALECFALPRED_007783 [Alectoria fallacina]|uniref:Uncharacterized protein n=1 Tax=Alectoria fallacina TaxID=1903189 RepID=A0A8H3EX97_9LECA|nr:MAG: hypothetical protein ALECFALPRED_007783 [Alectoria fallacina]